jgi:hypothetical protein
MTAVEDFKFILVTATDAKFYNFLKALASSIRINSPNVKLVVRVIGFTPSLEEFRSNYYEHTEFIFDDTVFNEVSKKYEYDKNSETGVKVDDISIYANNVLIHTINDHLNDGETCPLIYIDSDCLVRGDLSVVNSYLSNSDMALLTAVAPLHLINLWNSKYYQFGFVPMNRTPVVKSFFQEFKSRLSISQPKNEPLFNEVIVDYKDRLKIYEFDDSVVCGAHNVFSDDSLIWHASGANKFWNSIFRNEFFKYLGAKR